MTGAARPRISVFPKCYFDALYRGEMDYLAWIRSAPAFHVAIRPFASSKKIA